MPSPHQHSTPFRSAQGSKPFTHGHGGKISALATLPISALGDDYTVEGSGTITALPPVAAGATVFLRLNGTPTFKNSAKLICPTGVDYTGVLGDLVIARSDGNGVWRLFVVPRFTAGQLPGTATNDSASAGNVGEYQHAELASGISVGPLSYVTPVNVISVSLTAGDWEVWGQVQSNSITGAGTLGAIEAAINTTSATMASPGTTAFNAQWINAAGTGLPNNVIGPNVGPVRISVNVTTTVYLVAQITGSGSLNFNVYGQIRARRIR